MNGRDAAQARIAGLAPPRVVETVAIDQLDAAVLPPIRRQVVEVAPREAVTTFDKTGKLDELTDLALDKLKDILSEPFSPELEKLTAQQLAAAQTVLSTQTKVDDTRLRRRQTDMLPKIIEMIAKHEKGAMKVIQATALVLLLFVGQAHAEACVASIYTETDSGGPNTANGERVKNGALAAAHRTLPFGTRVTITNLDNGRRVSGVRINDRGPFVRGRCIDVTPWVAHLLAFDGLARVEVN